MKKTTLILGLALLSSGLSFGQTAEERAQITKDYDLEKSEILIQDFKKLASLRNARVTEYIIQNNVERTYVDESGKHFMIFDVVNSEPIYKTTFNTQAGVMQGANELWNGGSLGINIEGQNMEIGIWDGGKVRSTHEALTGRVRDGQLLFSLSSHGTHVAGTMIASGPNVNATGIAPQASVVSYSFTDNNDEAEVATEAAAGMIVSNHSYGIPAENVAQNFLGKYVVDSRNWDLILNTYPNLVTVISAGNSRNAGANTFDFGYDLLVGNATSKNAMVVGASVAQTNYSGPASVPMSNFSSWGPTDDGRVKPDITTKGVNMLSTDSANDSSYVSRQGTSMSAPATAGGLTLLQQYYNSLNSQYMRGSTVKSLALHTVKEAGDNDGPDYEFGWGLLDTNAAALVIQDNGNASLIDERNLAQSATYSQTFTANTSSKLIVSIGWYDPAGVSQGDYNYQGQSPDPTLTPEDNPTASLINNLDLKVTDASGTVFYPWKLSPNNFTTAPAATNNSDNDVDNFEKVEINNPSGTYTVSVTHKGNLQGGNQDYSLIITGADPATFSNKEDQLDSFSIYPNPATDHFTVAFNNQLSGDKINVNVYDVLGQEVMSRSFDNNGLFEQRISTADLNSGIYLVRVGNGITASTRKLIVR
ncbi:MULTISPECIES: S8 family serine peptidase [Flavobacteriaceae]|uniref:S8 family serine peptidase n=1 Tax=Flavobacteriaceae TaxID=49546 RepID=UPI003263BE18